MRASMALPGVFAPVTLDGKILSDGGMMRNLPVDIGRELCADVVIAVWMSSPPVEADGLTSALSLIGRSIDVMIGANERAAIASLTPRDVAINVPMGDIGTSNFTRIPEAVELGRRAADACARAARPVLRSGGRVSRVGRQPRPDAALPRPRSPRCESSAPSA